MKSSRLMRCQCEGRYDRTQLYASFCISHGMEMNICAIFSQERKLSLAERQTEVKDVVHV